MRAGTAHLVFCILRHIVQRCYVQLELSALAELPEAGTEADEIGAGDRDSETHRGFGDIVHSVFLQPEAIWLI